MDKATHSSLENQSLFRIFIELKDPRVKGRCLYPLINIIVITICALACGADSWEAIELFGRQRKNWLAKHIDLSNGIPSHQTLARVFSRIDPIQSQECFMKWSSEICQLLAEDIINIDGKTVCGSSHINGNKNALHLINAYATRQKITLGQVKTPDKSNEIKGIPLLLKALQIAGCIITMDAMGTQKGISKLIRIRKAHYVLALKKNHKRFYRKVDRLFNQADQLNYQGMVVRRWSDKNYDHGRIEERYYTALPMMYLHSYKTDWKDLQTFIRVKSVRRTAEGVEECTRYYISSLPLAKYHKAGQAIRQHWSIENGLHWKLDVGMNEDRCPIYRGNAAENLATMRKIVLFLLQKELSCQNGIGIKRIKAAFDTKYLRKVVGF
jgi:predicted transposase YbfD/YdcC